ncbi:hypothetical protein GDO81_007209 [Engystomops pustulosus]|uniref:CCHC-type domain-containing protein n=1 Tax=Engystomops pustulosus TaxID=76066 RepID=A0AAV7C5K8_ENGPU|nr:hypothetical protein GDO81_007209 [Engystomops pustulosus]
MDKIRYRTSFEVDLSRYTHTQSPRKLPENSQPKKYTVAVMDSRTTLTNIVEQMQQINTMVQEVAVRLHEQETAPRQFTMASPAPPEPPVQLPDKFSGDRKRFCAFREGCKLFFRLRPRSSGDEVQKVGIVMSLLQGSPQEWAFSLPPSSPELQTVDGFFQALGLLYEDPDSAANAERHLTGLRQGRRPVEEYCSEFRQWSGPSTWNDSALRFQFRVGLNDRLKDLLVAYPTPSSLEDSMTLAIRVDRRLRDRLKERGTSDAFRPSPIRVTNPSPSPPAIPPSEEPMQVDSTDAKTRRAYRVLNNLCFYCGKAGHRVRQCPSLPGPPPENFYA